MEWLREAYYQLHFWLDWLSTLGEDSVVVTSLRITCLLLAIPGIAVACYVWVFPHLEDAWEWIKDVATGLDQIPLSGMERIDCNGNGNGTCNQREQELELSTPEMVERINYAALRVRAKYPAYSADESEDRPVNSASTHDIRNHFHLYDGTNHSLAFLYFAYSPVVNSLFNLFTPFYRQAPKTRRGFRPNPLFQSSPMLQLKGPGRENSTQQINERKSYMKTIILAILASLIIAFVAGTCPAEGQTSVTATGDVFSISSTSGLKIERADGSKLAAHRGNDPDVVAEYDNADIGEFAFGRASCVNGVCAWTCLVVVDECSTPGIYYALTGTVIAKEVCAGVLIVTVLIEPGADIVGELRAPCLGNKAEECSTADVGESVFVGLDLICGDYYWRSIR